VKLVKVQEMWILAFVCLGEPFVEEHCWAFVAGSFFDCGDETKALDDPITAYNSLVYFLL
jgi:hypothetical protein